MKYQFFEIRVPKLRSHNQRGTGTSSLKRSSNLTFNNKLETLHNAGPPDSAGQARAMTHPSPLPLPWLQSSKPVSPYAGTT